jgi:hypothetical protein
MKRPREQPCPEPRPPRAHEVVDDDPPGGEAIEGLERSDDLIVGQVMEEEAAGHVVECAVPERRPLDIRCTAGTAASRADVASRGSCVTSDTERGARDASIPAA